MESNELQETTTAWRDLDEPHQAMAIAAYCTALKVGIGRRQEMHKVFEIGQPIMIFGADDNYCRIHQSSTQVMKILFDNYL